MAETPTPASLTLSSSFICASQDVIFGISTYFRILFQMVYGSFGSFLKIECCSLIRFEALLKTNKHHFKYKLWLNWAKAYIINAVLSNVRVDLCVWRDSGKQFHIRLFTLCSVGLLISTYEMCEDVACELKPLFGFIVAALPEDVISINTHQSILLYSTELEHSHLTWSKASGSSMA